MAGWPEVAGPTTPTTRRRRPPVRAVLDVVPDPDTQPPAVESTEVELLGARPEPSGGGAARPSRSNIVIGRYLGTVVVTVHGDLDAPRAGHLGTILADLIDGQGNLSVTVDLHDATSTDPDALSVFTEAAERARRRGGTMTLSDAPPPLHQALQLRGLDEFLGVAPG